jgi:hypothetical protein
MNLSRTKVLAFVFDWLKVEGYRKGETTHIRIGQRRYLDADALVLTPLLPGERAGLSAQMRIYTASGTA